MGYSQDSFYRFKELYDQHGEAGLQEISRKKPNPKNRVAPEVEEAVVAMATEYPAYGQVRVSNELKKRGLFVSPGGVRSIWLRHELSNFKLRLKALEKQVADNQSMILTEAQVAALEKAKQEKEAHGEIETEHPGYLGAQDTYSVGTIKGVGRIYQQTFIATYSKTVFVKLYDRKKALVAVDLLNDRVLPFFEQQAVLLLRMLTDRGTEYCGSLQNHEYQLYLVIENIDHTRTKARHPQTNGLCERFHRTIQDEFYAIAFRKKIYTTLEELQTGGSSSTIGSGPTPANTALDVPRCRPSARPNTWHKPNNWIRSLNGSNPSQTSPITQLQISMLSVRSLVSDDISSFTD